MGVRSEHLQAPLFLHECVVYLGVDYVVNDGRKEMTEMIDANAYLIPCPFCGGNPDLDANYAYCQNPSCYIRNCGIEIGRWKNSYCWKRIEELEADYSSEVQAKELAIEKVIALEKELKKIKGGAK